MKALSLLDEKLAAAGMSQIKVIIGGGGSMMICHGYDGQTRDIDAIPLGIDFETVKPFIAEVAKELNIDEDWFNPHFQSFTLYLDEDAKDRYEKVFTGKVIAAYSLGAEDILIMKFMAGRPKDMSHINFLLRRKQISLESIEKRLIELEAIFPKEATRALELFYDKTEE